MLLLITNRIKSLVTDNMHNGRIQRDLRRYDEQFGVLSAVLRTPGDLYSAFGVRAHICHRGGGQWNTGSCLCEA